MSEMVIEIKGPPFSGKTYLLQRLADYLFLFGYHISPNFDANRLLVRHQSAPTKELLLESMVSRAVREYPAVAIRELLRLTQREAELEQDLARLKEIYGVLP